MARETGNRGKTNPVWPLPLGLEVNHVHKLRPLLLCPLILMILSITTVFPTLDPALCLLTDLSLYIIMPKLSSLGLQTSDSILPSPCLYSADYKKIHFIYGIEICCSANHHGQFNLLHQADLQVSDPVIILAMGLSLH